jgi:polar amino acid transport system substrate-binding protein
MVAAAVATAGLLAGCSAGSTPTLPSGPTPTTSASTATASVGPRPGCDNNNPSSPTRVQSYAPGASVSDLASGASIAAIKQRNKLRAAVSADNLLFGFRNPVNGKLEGFDIDMVRTIARSIFDEPTASDAEIDQKIDYKVVNFAQRIPALLANQVDVVADIMTINCTRWNQIAFSAVYYTASQKLLVPKGSGETIDDMDGKQVCTATGSTGSENLADNHKQVKAVLVDDISDCLVLFQQGKVDGIISDDTVVAGFASQDPYAEVSPKTLSAEPYGLGFQPRQTDLVRYVNALLEQMRADGTWVKLYNQWLRATLGGGTQPTPTYGRA